MRHWRGISGRYIPQNGLIAIPEREPSMSPDSSLARMRWLAELAGAFWRDIRLLGEAVDGEIVAVRVFHHAVAPKRQIYRLAHQFDTLLLPAHPGRVNVIHLEAQLKAAGLLFLARRKARRLLILQRYQ